MSQSPEKYANDISIRRLLNIQKERLQELTRKGILKYDGRKKGYHISDTVKAYIGYLKKQIEESQLNRNRRTISEIADILGVDQRWVNQLAKDKGLPRLSHGVYDLVEVTRYRLRALREEIEIAQAGGEDAIRAKTRLTIAQADMKELELKQLDGEIGKVSDFVKQIEPVFAAINNILVGIPSLAAREYGDTKLEVFLDEKLRKARTELSQLTADLHAK